MDIACKMHMTMLGVSSLSVITVSSGVILVSCFIFTMGRLLFPRALSLPLAH